jgi:hypothetical protein
MMIIRQKKRDQVGNGRGSAKECTREGCVEQRKREESVIISFEYIQRETRSEPRKTKMVGKKREKKRAEMAQESISFQWLGGSQEMGSWR